MLDGTPHTYKTTDKITEFLTHPYHYMDGNELMPLYTRESPAKLGIRHVPARKTRGISVSKLGSILGESILIPALMTYQTEEPDSYRPLGTSRDFRLGSEIGVWTYDHAGGCFASSNSGYMAELADYSSWDVSVQRDNCFVPFANGIISALNDAGVSTTYGHDNVKTLQDIVGHIPVLEGDAYYKIPDPSLSEEESLIHTVSLGSGKLMTASGNNHFNASLRENVMDERAKAGIMDRDWETVWMRDSSSERDGSGIL
jgi:hypothetical protein